jgi:thymidylate kinase
MSEPSTVDDGTAAAFMAAFFDRLAADDITYCVMGAYDRTPDWTDGDVDVWAADGDQRAAADAISRTAEELGWAVIEKNTSPRLSEGEGKYAVVSTDDPGTVVHLDLWTFNYWRSVQFLDNAVIEETLTRDADGYYVAAPGVEAADSLLGDVLHGRPLDASRRERVGTLLARDDGAFERVLAGPFGDDLARTVGDLARDGRWDTLVSMQATLRRRLLARSLRRSLVWTAKRACRYLAGGLRYRILGEHGAFVAVIGPDGAGKTSTAESLLDSQFARQVFERQSYWYRDIPVLPTMGEIAAKLGLESLSTSVSNGTADDEEDTDDGTASDATDTDGTAARDLEPLPTRRAVIYPVYYALNDTLGRWRLWRGKTDGGELMVCDRYFYEFELQCTYDNCPEWLVRACQAAVPDPDLLVFATADSETIRDRRSELPLSEIERQQAICRSLVDRHDGITVETVGGVDDVVTTVKRVLLERTEDDS